MMPVQNHRLGLLLTLGGVLAFVPDGLLVRLTGLDGTALIGWRGLIAGSMILLACFAVWRGRVVSILMAGGWTGVAVGFFEGSALITFHYAMEATTVANVLVGFSVAPIIAAILSRLFLGEQLETATIWAIVGCVTGMLIVAYGAAGSGTDLWGLFLALLNATLLAAFYVSVRGLGSLSPMPFIGLGFLAAGFAGLSMAPLAHVAGAQALALIVNAGIGLPLALALLSLGARYLPAPEVAMLTLLQTVFGPLLVWWLLDERPLVETVIGGTIIVTTLLLHAIRRFREPPPLKPVRDPSP